MCHQYYIILIILFIGPILGMPKMKGLEVATGDIKAKGQRDRIMPMISTVTDSLRGMCSGDRQV